MDQPLSSRLAALAIFSVLAGLAVSNILLTQELRDGNRRMEQELAGLKAGIDDVRTAQKESAERFKSLNEQIQSQGDAMKTLQDTMGEQRQALGALQEKAGLAEPKLEVTPAQRTAAEKFYEKYLYPKSNKQVSVQVSAAAEKTGMQGAKINKWLEFAAADGAATLVGTGQPFMDVKPGDFNNANYNFFNQGRTLTMVVINFRGKDDPVFSECRKAMQKKPPDDGMLAVFGHGVGEQVLHDGLVDEVIIDLDRVVNCGIEANP